jgi:hypothetical protein
MLIMKKSMFVFAVAAAVVCMLDSLACHQVSPGASNPIVGAWFVKAPGAPFQYHMFLFSSDGTMQQANPDAGDANTSDSDGLGVWIKDGDRIKGKFVEVTADRATRLFLSRGEISFDIKVDGDAFRGPASARFYDVNGTLIRGPLPASLEGQRVRTE